MEYSSIVKETANDLVLKFSRHLAEVSLFSPEGMKNANTKDNGTFAFDLSALSEKEKSHVLSLVDETIKFSYTFKIKGKDAKVISYERNVGGIPLSLVNFAITLSFLIVGFLVLTFLYLLVNWFFF